MSDYLKMLENDAKEITARTDEDGKILCIYNGQEGFRSVRLTEICAVEVLVGTKWHNAYISPNGFRHVMVR